MKGLEPSRLTALAPKASVSTNSTTSAYCIVKLEFYVILDGFANTQRVYDYLRFTQPPHPYVDTISTIITNWTKVSITDWVIIVNRNTAYVIIKVMNMRVSHE